MSTFTLYEVREKLGDAIATLSVVSHMLGRLLQENANAEAELQVMRRRSKSDLFLASEGSQKLIGAAGGRSAEYLGCVKLSGEGAALVARELQEWVESRVIRDEGFFELHVFRSRESEESAADERERKMADAWDAVLASYSLSVDERRELLDDCKQIIEKIDAKMNRGI